MNGKITKWGNSLWIRIPKQIAEESKLKAGDKIEITAVDSKIVIIPQKPKYTLEKLLEGMSEEHLHSEIDWGQPEGKEIWWVLMFQNEEI